MWGSSSYFHCLFSRRKLGRKWKETSFFFKGITQKWSKLLSHYPPKRHHMIIFEREEHTENRLTNVIYCWGAFGKLQMGTKEHLVVLTHTRRSRIFLKEHNLHSYPGRGIWVNHAQYKALSELLTMAVHQKKWEWENWRKSEYWTHGFYLTMSLEISTWSLANNEVITGTSTKSNGIAKSYYPKSEGLCFQAFIPLCQIVDIIFSNFVVFRLKIIFWITLLLSIKIVC